MLWNGEFHLHCSRLLGYLDSSFLLPNAKQADPETRIQIGKDWVTRKSSAKLLGIIFEDNQQWKSQIYGKGGVLSALISRLYITRRLKNHSGSKSVLKLVDELFTSKIRYGLQLYGKVRTAIEDPECTEFRDIQLIQNKLLRSLNGTKIKDLVSTKSFVIHDLLREVDTKN